MHSTEVDAGAAERVASLRPLFMPESVAVIGASRDPRSIGYRVLAGMLAAGFRGPIYPINPSANDIAGHRAYPSVATLPAPVDLAVVITPRDTVPGVLEMCAARGVRAAVVISAGFAESGPEGAALQTQIADICRQAGLRLVGPNCLGLLNTDPAVRLNASFAPVYPEVGRVAMSSQSGGLAVALLAAARHRGVGVSTFVSIGNKADVSGNDLLEYWEQDSTTDVILLYLESFGNPRRFARVARRVARSKPIIALKGGRSVAGGRAAGSHTAALAANEVAVDALFHQSGVIRVETMEDLFDTAALLANQPLPAGPRIGIVTNAGGPGILAADACEAAGLNVPRFSPDLRQRLAAQLARGAGVDNPVDMIAAAGPRELKATVATLLSSAEIDAVIAVHVSVGGAKIEELCAALRAAADESGSRKPVLACLTDAQSEPPRLIPALRPIPVFEFPEGAARALGHAARYSAWRGAALGASPRFANNFAEAGGFVRQLTASASAEWLSADETRQLLRLAGFSMPPSGVARTADDAADLAAQVGAPFAVKLASRSLLHKSDVGGVRLNLQNANDARTAFSEIKARVDAIGRGDAFEGVLIQPMIRDAIEIVVGMTTDPQFGPLLMFGLGGVFVEVLSDVCFRVTPLTDRDAAEMVRSIKGYRLLEGYRGHPRCDIAALEQLLLRLSGLIEAVPEIIELDFNPVMALAEGRGAVIVDARIRVNRVAPNRA